LLRSVDDAELTPAVEVRGLTVRFGSRYGLQDATASAKQGDVVCLVGLNGSGKSTLLKAIVGMVRATGYVSVLGRSDDRRRRLVAFLPQREEINWNFPVTVLEVVMMGRASSLTRLVWTTRADREAALEALAKVDLADLRDRGISELSGGQQQRAMLARALYSEAPVLLLDEPLTGIDPTTRDDVLDLLRRLADGGTTVLLATHDILDANRIADRAWGLNGTVVADIPGAELLDEAVLRKIYGERLIVLSGTKMAIGDQVK
jgi:ABC-type Mn2+/Zn2+ transport system ATPase subunit